jgi:neprilysin
LRTQNDTFLENLFSILNFEAERNIAKLRKAVDKDKWATEPAVVNAFYNPNKNDIGKTRVP